MLPTWRGIWRELPPPARRLGRIGEYWLPLTGLVILFASLWAFGALIEDVATRDPIVHVDTRLANWLHAHSTPWLTDVFKVVTTLGNGLFLLAVCLVGSLWLAWRRRHADVVLLVAAFCGGEVLTFALKQGFHRERPFFPDPLATERTFSFPSGHATVSMAVYGAVAFIAARELSSWRASLACLVGAGALVAAIGFSRLYLGVHYLSDVLAGLAGGLAWLLVCIFAIALHEARPLRKRSRQSAQTLR